MSKKIGLNRFFKYQSDDWYVENAAARPLMMSAISRGFADGLKVGSYKILLNYYKDGEIYWMTLIEDQDKIAEAILKKYERDKNYWRNEFKKWLKIKKKIEKTFHGLRKKDLKVTSDNELLQDMKEYIDLQWGARKTSSLIDAFIFAAERDLPGLLCDFTKTDKGVNPGQAIEILTKPEDPSFINSAEHEIIEMTREIKRDKKLKKIFLSKKIQEEEIKRTNVYKKIKKHIERFAWLNVESFFGGNEYEFSDVVSNIREMLNLNLKEEERKNKSWVRNKKEKKDYISKYKFNSDILAIAKLSPLFAKWQDLRKENTMMTTYLDTKYLKEIAKRKRTSDDDLAYLYYLELDYLMKDKFDLSLLKKRRKGCLFAFKGSEYRVYYQDEVKDFIEKILYYEKSGVKEFSGTPASSGKVKGLVKVIIKKEEVNKLKKGEILISTMTRPEHIIAMRKAGAIVTNDGGITCHAAIISRELKIPCIIGTKIATKVLKDGDKVEVDADRGIVKVVK